MINDIFQDAEKRMEKSLDNLATALTKLRTGRAHPSLLDHIMVSYYGTDTPINQVASIAVEDARTLMITPWEQTMVAAIEKAIMSSDLGLNPNTAGNVIRVPMPALTEERRKDLIKVVRQEGEQTRIAMRNIRRDALSHIKDLNKEKQISEDEAHHAEEKMQKTIDTFSKKVDNMIHHKEVEMMQV